MRNKLRTYFYKKDIFSAFIILFFIAYFIVGNMIYQDYGLTPDDARQRYHSLVTYNQLFLQNQEYVTDVVDTNTIPGLNEYGVFYGVFLQLPMILIEHLKGFQWTYMQVFHIRHLYVFCWMFLSAICFYQLCKEVSGKNRGIAFLGTLIYIVMPRIFADSMYNIKDALCVALFTIALYFGTRAIRYEKKRDIYLFILFDMLCATSRIVGAVLLGSYIMILLWRGLWKGQFLRSLKTSILSSAVSLILYVAFTPKAWGNIIGILTATVNTFSNYSIMADVYCYYLGKKYVMGNLPWHYLLVWIGITLPTVYLVFFLAAMVNNSVRAVRGLLQKDVSEEQLLQLFFLSSLVIPVAYVLVTKPVLYNGWRHFYFIYPLIAVEIITVVRYLNEKKHLLGIVASGVLAGEILFTGIWMVRNHPYEYVYFNPLIREYAMGNFEVDTYHMTLLEAYLYILENDSRKNIPVNSRLDGCEIELLKEYGSDRIKLKSAWQDGDWIISEGNTFDGAPYYDCVKVIESEGFPITRIWHLERIPEQTFELNFTGSEVLGSTNDVEWSLIEEDPETVTFEGRLIEGIPFNWYAITTDIAGGLENSKVEVSSDGESWVSLSAQTVTGNEYTTEFRSAPMDLLGAVRITMPASMRKETGRYSLCAYETVDSREAYDGNRAGRLLEGIWTNNTQNPQALYADDERMETRFLVENQTPGIYIEMQLSRNVEITRICADYGEYPWDTPEKIHIFISDDKKNWSEVEYQCDNGMDFDLIDPISAKYIRMELGDTGADIEKSWSVCEIRMFTKIGK